MGVGLGASGAPQTVIRTFPRVYPDVAGVVGGVVGEAAPQPIAGAARARQPVLAPIPSSPVAELAVPALPKLLAINGSAPAAGLRVDTSGGLTLSLGGRRRIARRAASVRRDRRRQLRGSDQRRRPRRCVTVPRALLAHLRAPATAHRRTRRRRCRSRSRAGSARASRS